MGELTNIYFHINLGSNYSPEYSMLSRVNKFMKNISQRVIKSVKNNLNYNPCEVVNKRPTIIAAKTNQNYLQLETTLRYGINLEIDSLEITNKSIYSGSTTPIKSYSYLNNILSIYIDKSYSDKNIFLQINAKKRVNGCSKPYIITANYYPSK